MAGAVSAGMCAALEALGLINGFDVIYGSSAGSLNASSAASGLAQRRALLYVLAARRGHVDQRRVLVGRRPLRLTEIFDSLLREYPLSGGLLGGRTVPLKVVATCVERKEAAAMSGFSSLEQLHTALAASCSIPGITGDVVECGGRHFVDGALSEPVPYELALREGATHVLVLRTCQASHRLQEWRGLRRRLVDRLLRNAPGTVREMFYELPARYNAHACELQSPSAAGLAGRVAQLALLPDAPGANPLERHASRVFGLINAGARTVYHALAAPEPRAACTPRGVAAHRVAMAHC
jgi:predicted acylesterase/phospholipase RssA